MHSRNNSTSTLPNPTRADWDTLVFGIYALPEVQRATRNHEWQKLRVHLLGMQHRYRFQLLRKYAHELDTIQPPLLLHSAEEWADTKHLRRVRVTNYVHALRRGGLIP